MANRVPINRIYGVEVEHTLQGRVGLLATNGNGPCMVNGIGVAIEEALGAMENEARRLRLIHETVIVEHHRPHNADGTGLVGAILCDGAIVRAYTVRCWPLLN